jgi:hypothetical protein
VRALHALRLVDAERLVVTATLAEGAMAALVATTADGLVRGRAVIVGDALTAEIGDANRGAVALASVHALDALAALGVAEGGVVCQTVVVVIAEYAAAARTTDPHLAIAVVTALDTAPAVGIARRAQTERAVRVVSAGRLASEVETAHLASAAVRVVVTLRALVVQRVAPWRLTTALGRADTLGAVAPALVAHLVRFTFTRPTVARREWVAEVDLRIHASRNVRAAVATARTAPID